MNLILIWFLKFLRDATIVATFFASILVIILYFDSHSRHLLFRAFVEAPSGAFYYVIRRDMFARRFTSAAGRLQQQLNLITGIRTTKSSMLPGLIDNTRFVVEHVAIPDDWRALRPFLSNLVVAATDIHWTHLWYGRSLAYDDPEKALEHLAMAADLSGPAPAPYRVAIWTAFRNGMKEELREWCRRYREEEFGGLRTYHYNNRFLETGMRRMALRVQLNNGENRYFGHRGLALGENREYVFVFDEPLTIDQIALVLGIVPGVLVDIKSVTFRTGSEAETFDTDEFLIFPQSGYSVEGGNLSTSRDGETLEFEFPEEAFNEVHSISVEVATDRARIASATVCGGAQTR